MEKLTEVLAMGGYGAFVWPAYALAAAVLVGVSLASRRALKKAQVTLAQLQLPADADEA